MLMSYFGINYVHNQYEDLGQYHHNPNHIWDNVMLHYPASLVN